MDSFCVSPNYRVVLILSWIILHSYFNGLDTFHNQFKKQRFLPPILTPSTTNNTNQSQHVSLFFFFFSFLHLVREKVEQNVLLVS